MKREGIHMTISTNQNISPKKTGIGSRLGSNSQKTSSTIHTPNLTEKKFGQENQSHIIQSHIIQSQSGLKENKLDLELLELEPNTNDLISCPYIDAISDSNSDSSSDSDSDSISDLTEKLKLKQSDTTKPKVGESALNENKELQTNIPSKPVSPITIPTTKGPLILTPKTDSTGRNSKVFEATLSSKPNQSLFAKILPFSNYTQKRISKVYQEINKINKEVLDFIDIEEIIKKNPEFAVSETNAPTKAVKTTSTKSSDTTPDSKEETAKEEIKTAIFQTLKEQLKPMRIKELEQDFNKKSKNEVKFLKMNLFGVLQATYTERINEQTANTMGDEFKKDDMMIVSPKIDTSGDSIAELLKTAQDKNLKLTEIAYRLLTTLVHFEEKGVRHRDIKNANLGIENNNIVLIDTGEMIQLTETNKTEGPKHEVSFLKNNFITNDTIDRFSIGKLLEKHKNNSTEIPIRQIINDLLDEKTPAKTIRETFVKSIELMKESSLKKSVQDLVSGIDKEYTNHIKKN